MVTREPVLQPVLIKALRPTQMTVGMREVAAKRRHWQSLREGKGGEFLGHHMVPAVLGPRKRYYVVDHHHLCRALMDEGVEHVAVTVVADLHKLPADAFWFVMENRDWMHPYDAAGRRRDPADMPKSMAGLVDDPFRSLAGEVRLAGGYAKDTTPFSEFLWADFLRRRLKRKVVLTGFDAALAQAMNMAREQEASYLPGWCGPVKDN